MVAAGVRFVTHDAAYRVLNGLEVGKFPERVGCIEVMDNVFIGYNATILPNVRIGENCIIGAGSTVTKDLEPNGVYVGTPAKRISSFDEYVQKCAEIPGGGTTTLMFSIIREFLKMKFKGLGASLKMKEASLLTCS